MTTASNADLAATMTHRSGIIIYCHDGSIALDTLYMADKYCMMLRTLNFE